MAKNRIRRGEGLPPLLRQLCAGGSLTGPELARQLSISRAAVWKQVQSLRAAGLAIRAGTDGYALVHALEPLDVERIHAALPASGRRRLGTLENHWRLDSTSSEVARRVATLPDRSFVFADWQQAGRGRRGRAWFSPPATNLQCSCLKRFAGGYAALAGLSLVVGVAVAQALEDHGVEGAALKWPNDVVAGDAKLGGILVELGGDFMGPCHAIIGIGINLRMSNATRAVLDRPCADLAGLCGGRPPSRNALAAALIARLVAALDTFEVHGFKRFAAAWAERDALMYRKVRVEAVGGTFEGVATGVDARGALRVRTTAGTRSVDSAEVSVRAA